MASDCAMCHHKFRGTLDDHRYQYVDEHDTWPRHEICVNCWLRSPHRKPNFKTLEEISVLCPKFRLMYDEWHEKFIQTYECYGCKRKFKPNEIDCCQGYGKKIFHICKSCNEIKFYDKWKYKETMVYRFNYDYLYCPSCKSRGSIFYHSNQTLWCSHCSFRITGVE